MEVFPVTWSKGTLTYCLMPWHKLYTAPTRKSVSDGKMGSTEEGMVCAIDAMSQFSLLEQAQYGNS